MNASRYSRTTETVEPRRFAATVSGRTERTSRATAKTQISPSSCSGVRAILTEDFLLLNARGFADLFAQVVQTAPSDDASFGDLNPLDTRAVQ